MAEQEQNQSEEATPFKLRKAREKGQVARGADLGFFGGMVALGLFTLFAGPIMAGKLLSVMRISLTSGFDHVNEPSKVLGVAAAVAWPTLLPLILLGCTSVTFLVFLELLQLRGFIFSSQPLKPDFSRLNPAKGLKRLFSVHMLKEAAKNVAKFIIYGLVSWLVVSAAAERFAGSFEGAQSLVNAMNAAGLRLIFTFVGLAFMFALFDQLIVRARFAKQMRMSKRDVTREHKDREGEPRIKQKRKQLHAEYAAQNGSLGSLAGSDVVITNPDHYAVGLRYDPRSMAAPMVTARGRNKFALALKREAFGLGIPTVENRPLARKLFRSGVVNREVPAGLYRDVAGIYITLRTGTVSGEQSS